ncbi:uncharacterized protein RAG0_16042 [Rhynchosporium agropyri]|uniref:Uncharacterized protein n=1 Tax=Rhynchosporium agropyri TaxID=914238 RepID=A0A1E1LNI8_9HELO|nr:uncharacterized protein RAG0_16042 [Rhynchosporium agropyri]
MEKPKLITHHTTRLIALLESQPCVYGAQWQLDQSLITWIIMEAQEDLESVGYYDKMNMEEQVWALFSHVYRHFYPYGHGFPKYNMSPPPSDSLPAQQTQEPSGALRHLSATAKPFIPRTIESARPSVRKNNQINRLLID